ncbi:hypothetical protein A2291_03175 [candidate division WOR-1 bacterium RIFOXYB2_FULL_42_35]|uniref:Uncharacterized protein n=1 Tax=candidate division WOR-1 bacterium RIFOXYC2_FULL_41_25 TaxID=1802586 RepID=A0A1F4TIJ5_UNCSA|nr:MAG: hypothetical protein A2247_02250 [candidate division WOR-1 bacterium RIFOXYA2_FULL_41_14]OGC21560.1 MAG: hypothetical protein A2291_03175 [candidate division WOR-1 bacterium RIFOXYB2_FULL_42_35]OGC32538.1 MAG: hypothetical protein A2462_02885 [candidate division WOR-1 bacterium RIFOXYC2_FULL_41_25]
MPNLNLFKEKLTRTMHPNLTAKELADLMVNAVLETEYGQTFSLSPGYAGMISTLGNSILNNPELRRQALAITNIYLRNNYGNQENIG